MLRNSYSCVRETGFRSCYERGDGTPMSRQAVLNLGNACKHSNYKLAGALAAEAAFENELTPTAHSHSGKQEGGVLTARQPF